MDIQKISVVGFGNVGSHLVRSFDDAEIEVTHVLSKNSNHSEFSDLKSNVNLVHDISDLPEDQLILLCIPDDQIKNTIESINPDTPIAYTSGSVELKTIDRNNVGVFYPLQTFTKGKPLNIFETPFFIESKDKELSQQLFDLGWKLSRKVEYADSDTRKKLHLAAVFVNNFTNHMNFIAKEYLDSHELNYEYLIPLLQETANKLIETSPVDAQTGPARRKDFSIIEKHVESLKGSYQEIYRVVTQSILNTYQTK